MEFHFDFTQDARRASISAQLKEALGEGGWAAVTAEAFAAGVPKAHQHGIVEVRRTICNLKASQEIKDHLMAVYEILAAAEAQVHDCAVDDTHFHEVGNGAAILDALITCCAFAHLHPSWVTATPVQTGSGTVECSHGLLDIPAPATVAILKTGIPTCKEKFEGELCTPTSAALIKHFVDEFVQF